MLSAPRGLFLGAASGGWSIRLPGGPSRPLRRSADTAAGWRVSGDNKLTMDSSSHSTTLFPRSPRGPTAQRCPFIRPDPLDALLRAPAADERPAMGQWPCGHVWKTKSASSSVVCLSVTSDSSIPIRLIRTFIRPGNFIQPEKCPLKVTFKDPSYPQYISSPVVHHYWWFANTVHKNCSLFVIFCISMGQNIQKFHCSPKKYSKYLYFSKHQQQLQ